MLIRFFKAGSTLSIIDQGISSLSNFLTTVLMARILTAHDFGIYTLLVTSILVINGLANAIVTEPIRVLGVQKQADSIDRYFTCQIIFLGILGFCTALLVFVAICFVDDTGTKNALAFAVCVLATQFQELVRAFNATRFNWRGVLASDAVNHTTRLLLLFVLAQTHLLIVDTGLYAIAIGCVAGSLVSTLAGATLAKPTFAQAKAELWRNWNYGKWLLLESVVFVASSQVYLYLIALWVDIESAGAFSAAQTLVGSLNVLLIGITTYSMPVARRTLIRDGYRAWCNWLSKVGIAAIGVALLACVILSIAARPLLGYLFAPAYTQYAYLVPVLGLVMVLSVANGMLSIAFRTAEMPQIGFSAKFAAAVVTGAIAYPLIHSWGVAGAVIGLVITQLCWLVVSAFQIFFKKTISEHWIDHLRAAHIKHTDIASKPEIETGYVRTSQS